jgi:hypothetical protein
MSVEGLSEGPQTHDRRVISMGRAVFDFRVTGMGIHRREFGITNAWGLE